MVEKRLEELSRAVKELAGKLAALGYRYSITTEKGEGVPELCKVSRGGLVEGV